jgi:hypothetical protein
MAPASASASSEAVVEMVMTLSQESVVWTVAYEERFEEPRAGAGDEVSLVSVGGGGEDSGRGDNIVAGLKSGWEVIDDTEAEADAMTLR